MNFYGVMTCPTGGDQYSFEVRGYHLKTNYYILKRLQSEFLVHYLNIQHLAQNSSMLHQHWTKDFVIYFYYFEIKMANIGFTLNSR